MRGLEGRVSHLGLTVAVSSVHRRKPEVGRVYESPPHATPHTLTPDPPLPSRASFASSSTFLKRGSNGVNFAHLSGMGNSHRTPISPEGYCSDTARDLSPSPTPTPSRPPRTPASPLARSQMSHLSFFASDSPPSASTSPLFLAGGSILRSGSGSADIHVSPPKYKGAGDAKGGGSIESIDGFCSGASSRVRGKA